MYFCAELSAILTGALKTEKPATTLRRRSIVYQEAISERPLLSSKFHEFKEPFTNLTLPAENVQ